MTLIPSLVLNIYWTDRYVPVVLNTYWAVQSCTSSFEYLYWTAQSCTCSLNISCTVQSCTYSFQHLNYINYASNVRSSVSELCVKKKKKNSIDEQQS